MIRSLAPARGEYGSLGKITSALCRASVADRGTIFAKRQASGSRGVANAFEKALRPVGQPVRVVPVRLGDHLDRAHLERRHRPLRLRRAEHHGHRMLTHQLAQEGKAIHPRHLDVEDDHAGDGLLQHFHRLIRIGGQHHPKPWVGLDDRLEPLSHDGAVVDDQDLDRVGVRQRLHRRGNFAPSHGWSPLLLK